MTSKAAHALPTGTLHVEVAKDGSGYYWAGHWRFDGKHVKRRLGRAHIELREHRAQDAKGWSGWYCKRRGRPDPGVLTADDATVALREAIKRHAEQVALAHGTQPVLFERVADEWLSHGAEVLGWKPSVERDYRAMLHAEDRTPRARGGAPKARVMRKWRGRRIDEIAESEVRTWLRELDREPGLSARSVNKHRQVMHAICSYAVEHDYATQNVVARVPKRKQADLSELRAYTVEQVELIARHTRDETTRALVLTAAYSGLRMGELLALQWRSVDFQAQRIRVVRSYSQGLGIVSPKSRKPRSVPLADQVAVVLDGLSRRHDHVSPDSLVFTITGKHIDPSTIRARFVRARDAARTEDGELPELRFHDLRHSFGTMAVSSGIDLLTVKEWMGHRDIATTMTYLHHRENAGDAAKLTAAFGHAAAPLAVPTA
jgi:integrase